MVCLHDPALRQTQAPGSLKPGQLAIRPGSPAAMAHAPQVFNEFRGQRESCHSRSRHESHSVPADSTAAPRHPSVDSAISGCLVAARHDRSRMSGDAGNHVFLDLYTI